MSVVLQKLLEVFKSVGPLLLVVCALQVTLVHAPTQLFLQFAVGSILAIVGLTMLFLGVDLGLLSMGKYIGGALPKRGSLVLIASAAVAIGFASTVSEPDVLVLSQQIEQAAHGSMASHVVLYVIALGLAFLATLAMLRIVFGWPMKYLLVAGYGSALMLAAWVPPRYVSLAFDAGSVTTGVLSAPVLIAMAMGVSSVLAKRTAISDGFGLVGLASIGPVIALLLMGVLGS